MAVGLLIESSLLSLYGGTVLLFQRFKEKEEEKGFLMER